MNADTVRALQRRLGEHRPVDPDDETTVGAAALGVDADGVLGLQTIGALQVFLGRDPTGELDRATVAALQAHLGAHVCHGDFDDPTTEALRNALADGTF